MEPTHDDFTKKPHRAFPVTRYGIGATNAWCWECGYFPLPLEGSVQLGPDAPHAMPLALRVGEGGYSGQSDDPSQHDLCTECGHEGIHVETDAGCVDCTVCRDEQDERNQIEQGRFF
jgi:hypothetical protein